MDRDASEWLAETLEATSGEPASLTRDGATVNITVVFGRVTPERYALADGRAQLEVEPADFLIRPAQYDFGSGPVEPERGDRVTVNGRIYEASPRDGEPCWRPDNQFRTMLRVRTIRVN